MSWICRKSPQLIDGATTVRQSGLRPGFELIQEKANDACWTWLTRDGPIRGIVLPGRSTVGRVRRASHAPVRCPLQLRLLAGARCERCRGSRTRDLSQGFTQFPVVPAGHQFPGMDVSNPEKQLSKFVLKTRAPHDRSDGL